MKILMVTSEATPFIKTGGLADVLGSLPAALAKLGDEIGVVLPRYRSAKIDSADRVWVQMPVWVGPNEFWVDVDLVVRNGVHYYLVNCPPLYDRDEVYGYYHDNHIRFAALSQAALGVARNIFRPDVLHGHDWHAGLAAPYLKINFGTDPTFFGIRTVFTIHNLGYQGNFGADVFGSLGIGASLSGMGPLEFWGQVSFMKAGILMSDAVTTVSPTYAHEIQTPEYGFGMDGVLRSRGDHLSGILNGVDYDEWSPEKDRHLPVQYSVEDLAGKRICKRAVLEEMGLPASEHDLDRPLIGIISRFAGQKGFDLVAGITDWLGSQDIGMVVLGSGEGHVEDIFRWLAGRHPGRFALRVGYDESLAHRIEAGADMFLMPSRYEPCGLNQIYSLRYGTVPVVRNTGGLADTVDAETGFKFVPFAPDALAGAIAEARQAFEDRAGWRNRMRMGMGRDFSWDASARRYHNLYNGL